MYYPKIFKNLYFTLIIIVLLFSVRCETSISENVTINEVEALIDSAKLHRRNNKAEESREFAMQAVKIASEQDFKKQWVIASKEIGNAWLYNDNASALFYYEKAKELCIEFEEYETLAQILNNIGEAYFYKNNYKKAIEYYTEAIEVRKLHNIYANIEDTYNNIGYVYYYLELYGKAAEAFIEALRIAEKKANNDVIATARTNIASCFSEQVKFDTNIADFKKAIKYFQKSLYLYKTENDSIGIANVLINIGDLYLNISKTDSAKYYTMMALDLCKKINYNDQLSIIFLNMGLIENTIENDSLALYYFSKALNIAPIYIEAKIQESIGEIYAKNNEMIKAEKYFNRLQSVYKNLSKVYEKTGRIESAYHAHKKYRNLHDTLFAEKKYKTVVRSEIKFEVEKKTQEIETLSLEKKNQLILIYSIVIAGMLLLILFMMLYRLNRIKQFNIQQLLEIKSLRTQMNPHLIGNTLSALQDIILDKRTIDAVSFVAKFSLLMRQLMINSKQNEITLEKELEFINLFIEIQKIRWKTDFDFSMGINQDIDLETTKIPPMLIQPYIENAIEHGLRHKTENRKLLLSIQKGDNDYILINIEDNGIGRKRAAEQNQKRKKHVSTSIININDRIALFNRTYKTDWKVEIIDIEHQGESQGVRVVIKISNLDEKYNS